MTITVYSAKHWDYADSYGLIACQLARHLEALGATVSAQALGRKVVDNQPIDVRAITERNTPSSPGGIVIGYPTNYNQFGELAEQGPRIALTMFESSKIPADWIAPLNECDAVIVPSRFCAAVFEKCGVTVPIYVVPLGVGDIYHYTERTIDRPLTFLAFLDRGGRKGGILAQQAFVRAFGEDTRYMLILKGRTPKPGREFTLTNANIEVIQRDMSETELYQLYLSADVMINPNYGEGFGLLPREFAATGGIALATGWGGTGDDIRCWGWPLPYMLEKAHWRGHPAFDGQDLGLWAKPDVEGIADVLRDVAANIDDYRQKASERANSVREMYSWRCLAESVCSIWQGLT